MRSQRPLDYNTVYCPGGTVCSGDIIHTAQLNQPIKIKFDLEKNVGDWSGA